MRKIRQWLTLARAFYRDSSFVILDEPTASLDAQAKAELFDRLRDLFKGRTVLFVAGSRIRDRHDYTE
ncbi:hypothetical protein [Amycolatopsis sp. cmx-11-12]|uniref:hypothetical protein n=1 Tax=Amycolatopsis sp. cmx-11-12 TaxID=2785795 RepID=UPI003918176D